MTKLVIFRQAVKEWPPAIIFRKLAYKDFECEEGESWCSMPACPDLKPGDIIQIIREV